MKTENNKGYNGWKNHATWATKLHLDNPEGDYEYFNKLAMNYKEAGKESYVFAEFLEETYERIFNDVLEGNGTEADKSMVRNVGNGLDVDWMEIAEAYYEDLEGDEKMHGGKEDEN